jgi:hypothetical protein
LEDVRDYGMGLLLAESFCEWCGRVIKEFKRRVDLSDKTNRVKADEVISKFEKESEAIKKMNPVDVVKYLDRRAGTGKRKRLHVIG